VKTLYVRYFDIDISADGAMATPVSPIQFDTASLSNLQIIPVVYIKNRVFEKSDSARVSSLAAHVYQLVSDINKSINKSINEIQFDCDWTDSTKAKYFFFLEKYRSISKQIISATIRLHQVKYKNRTGIPLVDFGVLMYYNMGEINSTEINSVYDKNTASRYVQSLKTYPLKLDIALPIFSWSMLIREGRVVKLLNKMNFSHFENDSNFTLVKRNFFETKHACFHGGYYFKGNDIVKIESVQENELLEIAEQINKYSNKKIGNIIFYDLDKANLGLYEKNIFREVSNHIN